MKRILPAAAAVAVVISCFIAFAGTAEAHETRKVEMEREPSVRE